MNQKSGEMARPFKARLTTKKTKMKEEKQLKDPRVTTKLKDRQTTVDTTSCASTKGKLVTI